MANFMVLTKHYFPVISCLTGILWETSSHLTASTASSIDIYLFLKGKIIINQKEWSYELHIETTC